MKLISVLILSVVLSGTLPATGKIQSNFIQKTTISDPSAPVNHPPGKPVLISPANGATIRLPAVVEWQCSDPDGDVLTYTVHVKIRIGGQVVYEESVNTGTTNKFDSRDYDNIPEEAFGLPIEWQVTASDGELETTGDTWTITVSGMNHPPVFTGSPVPADQSLTSPGTLNFSWKCTDADYDFLRYTFCSREAGSPVWDCVQGILYAGHSLNLSEDDAGKTYEWKVRADDGFEVTQSPIWSFSVCTPVEITEDIEICDGETYLDRDETGTWQWYKPAATGCDTLVTTHLTVWPAQSVTEDVFICEGDSYKGWTTEGQYKDTLTAVNGCDSIVTTLLTVNPGYHETEEVEIYNGDSYKDWTTSGQYNDTLVSVHGCDSIITTNLTVLNNPPDKPILISPANNAMVRQPFNVEWEGSDSDGDTLTYTVRIRPQGNELWTASQNTDTLSFYTIDGLPDFVFGIPIEWQVMAHDGQDTTYSDIWCVTIAEYVYETEYVSICEGESYKGWGTEGQYKDTLTTPAGCDSVVTTILSLYPSFVPEFVVEGDTLMAADEYTSYHSGRYLPEMGYQPLRNLHAGGDR